MWCQVSLSVDRLSTILNLPVNNSSPARIEYVFPVFNSISVLSRHFYRPETVSDTFATMWIILPCQHEGGEIRISHGSIVNLYQSARYYETSILAWRTGAIFEMAPITQGYCVVLCYNIIYTTDLPLPSLSVDTGATHLLREFLHMWHRLDEEGKGLDKLIVLQAHDGYRDRKPRYHALRLKAQDTGCAAVLIAEASRFGFRLGVATYSSTVEGHLNDDSGDAEMGSVFSRKVCIDGLVDLDGHRVTDYRLAFNEEDETYPENLAEVVEAQVYFSQETKEGNFRE